MDCHVMWETNIGQKHVMWDTLIWPRGERRRGGWRGQALPLRLLLIGFEYQQTKREIPFKICQRHCHAMLTINEQETHQR